MEKIETEIIINSNIEKVWEVLMDFDNYSNWNPFIKSITKDEKDNQKLKITVQSPSSKPMNFNPIILKSERNKEFRWKGKFLFKGLFDGEHYFILKENDDKSTTFIHGEIFTGLLVFLLKKELKKTELGFLLMNETLKKECEK